MRWFQIPARWLKSVGVMLGLALLGPSLRAVPFVLRHQSPGGPTLRAIAATSSLFVAVGDAGTILTSSDGASWSAANSGVSYALRGVTYGGGQFVAVGDNGHVLVSPDGAVWTPGTSGVAAQLNGVVFANSLFVAVGEGGTIITSRDAQNWTAATSGVTGSLRGVTFDPADGYFYAVGAGGLIIISSDANTWIMRLSLISADLNAAFQDRIVGDNVATTLNIVNLAWDFGGAVISGGGDWNGVALWPAAQFTLVVGDAGALNSSGSVVIPYTSGTTEDLKAVVFGQLNFVAVGADETIIETPTTVTNAVGEIRNLSTRAYISGSAETLTGGFVISGSGTKGLLIRASGPALAAFGVSAPVAAPTLTVCDVSGKVLAQNSGWSSSPNAAAIAAAAADVGAFSFAAGSADSAVLLQLPPGVYTAIVGAPGSGITLLELYDTDTLAMAPTARLVNLSSLCFLGTGEAAPVTGLTVPTGRSMLLRAVGPTLAQFGVANVVMHPRIDLIRAAYEQTSLDPTYYPAKSVANNEGWYVTEPIAADGPDPGVGDNGAAYQIQAAAAQCGAFPLPAYSSDAALLITLYDQMTLQVSTTDGQPGNVLIEAYDTIQ